MNVEESRSGEDARKSHAHTCTYMYMHTYAQTYSTIPETVNTVRMKAQKCKTLSAKDP